MKYLFNVLLLGLIVLTIPSCRDSRGIDMIYTDFFDIQSGANTIERHYFQNFVTANWSEFLGNLEAEDISQITPSFARITNTEGIPMDFITEIIIQIYPNQDTSVTPWEMAYRTDIPFNTGTTIEIIPGLANFKDEMVDDQFIYRIGLRYRNFPPATFRVVLDFGFKALQES